MITQTIGIGDYHKSQNVSHSKLKLFAERGAAAFKQVVLDGGSMEHDDDGEEKPAFKFGTAFECKVQTPARFELEYLVKPADMNLSCTKKDPRVEPFKEMAKTRKVLSEKEMNRIDRGVASMREHRLGQALLEASADQATIVYEHSPFRLQARPDWLSLGELDEDVRLDGGVVPAGCVFSIDLKTTESLNGLTSAYGLMKYGYHSQAALVRRLLELHNYPDTRHFIWAVEKQYPNRSAIIEIPPKLLDIGDEWVRDRCAELARCYRDNAWERTVQGIVQIEVPAHLSAA